MKTTIAIGLCAIGLSFNAYAADPNANPSGKAGAPAQVDGVSQAHKDGGDKGGKDKMHSGTHAKGGEDKGGKDKMHSGTHAKGGEDKGGKGGKDKMGASPQMKGDKDKMGASGHMKDGGDKGGKGGKDKMDMPHQPGQGAAHRDMNMPGAGARDAAPGR